MTKLTYEIRPTTVNEHKLILDIYHGNTTINNTFFDHGDIIHYENGRDELYLFDMYNNILVSFYIKINEITGIEYIKEITL